MPRLSRFISLIPALVLFSLGGCGDSGTDPEATVTVQLNVEGTIRSADGGEPIAGAQVELGRGGQLDAPQVGQTVETDGDGRYEMVLAVQYEETCPFLWVRAEAPGYQPSPIDQANVILDCVETLQEVDIELVPFGA